MFTLCLLGLYTTATFIMFQCFKRNAYNRATNNASAEKRFEGGGTTKTDNSREKKPDNKSPFQFNFLPFKTEDEIKTDLDSIKGEDNPFKKAYKEKQKKECEGKVEQHIAIVGEKITNLSIYCHVGRFVSHRATSNLSYYNGGVVPSEKGGESHEMTHFREHDGCEKMNPGGSESIFIMK
ncbi:hypothetical protein KIN20_008819 [Parelaphostrongylus tenuis]|uniref:Uncharacterized protein n=1 Tax=Parelaphostrongylus tenuis TaxID=148309 RepID=A0AAD5MPK8_PARTN|nr:hypothetical protein KIN20_008819 [Parelaphostrongylus tenuis]